jgi:hypothetical protein
MKGIKETVENEKKWSAIKKSKNDWSYGCRNTGRSERVKYESRRVKAGKNSVQYIALNTPTLTQ